MTTAFTKDEIARLAADIDGFVEGRRESLLELCRELVAARSVNPPGRTIEAAAVAEAFLDGSNVICETLVNDPSKPNLISQVNGNGPGAHLILNGHLDTVSPGREADWSVPLFETQIEGSNMTGLGMGNMKAGVAALSLAFVWLKQNTHRWSGKVTFTAVADETVFGPDGAGWLLGQRKDLKGDAVICGEGPGDMNLAIAEKGLLWVELTATAPSGQGMLARPGGSATSRLACALARIDPWNEIHVEPPAEIAEVAPNAGDHGQRLSVNIGTMKADGFVSQIATEATAEIDFRVPPGMATADIEDMLNELCKETPGLSWSRIKGWEPNWSVLNEPVAEAAANAAQVVRNRAPKPVVRLPASDASRWRSLGVPAICFGPQPLLASGVDDFARVDDIVACAKIYALASTFYLCR